jgi:hypothetical protein
MPFFRTPGKRSVGCEWWSNNAHAVLLTEPTAGFGGQTRLSTNNAEIDGVYFVLQSSLERNK